MKNFLPPTTDICTNQTVVSNISSGLEVALIILRRGVNYVKDEDISITRSYIYVTTDAIVSSWQRERKFYNIIWESYIQKNPKDAMDHPVQSDNARVEMILKECVRFVAYFKYVKMMNKSGKVMKMKCALQQLYSTNESTSTRSKTS